MGLWQKMLNQLVFFFSPFFRPSPSPQTWNWFWLGGSKHNVTVQKLIFSAVKKKRRRKAHSCVIFVKCIETHFSPNYYALSQKCSFCLIFNDPYIACFFYDHHNVYFIVHFLFYLIILIQTVPIWFSQLSLKSHSLVLQITF